MKRNFKRSLSLILAVLMVITVVPFGGMAVDSAECDHANATITLIDGVEHLVRCECGYRDYELCDGPAATTCGEAPKCTKCQAVIGEALAHDFSKEDTADRYIATEGDCQTLKTYYQSCVVCGALPELLEEALTFEGEAYGDHVFTTYEAKGDATCTEPGHKVAVCDVCEEETDEIDADESAKLPHNYVEVIDDKYKVLDATCSSNGVYYVSCEDCGEAGTETFTTEKTAHNFAAVENPEENALLKSAATCSKPAVYYMSCTVCFVTAKAAKAEDEVFTYGEPHARPTKFSEVCKVLYEKDEKGNYVTDAKGNNIVLRDREVIFEATCMEPEKCSYLCAACGEPLVPADEYVAGNKYSADYELYINYDHPALNPNHQLEKAIINGKEVKLMELVEGVDYWDATCVKEGKGKTYKCLFHDGANNIVGGETIPVIGHKYDTAKSKAFRDADCRMAGHYASMSCTECKTTYYFDKTGKANGTDNFDPKKDPIDKTIPKLEHKDTDGDGLCDLIYVKANGQTDYCGLHMEAENAGCTCICHSTGFMYLIAMILKWFWKFTNSKQYCECGTAHY